MDDKDWNIRQATRTVKYECVSNEDVWATTGEVSGMVSPAGWEGLRPLWARWAEHTQHPKVSMLWLHFPPENIFLPLWQPIQCKWENLWDSDLWSCRFLWELYFLLKVNFSFWFLMVLLRNRHVSNKEIQKMVPCLQGHLHLTSLVNSFAS